MVKSRKIIIFILLLLIAFFITSCQGNDVTEEDKVIKIGVSTPLSGPAAGWGTPQLRAIELLMEEYNEAGGITINDEQYTFKVIAYDDKFEPTEIAAIANKLIYEDKVHVLMGQSVFAAALPIVVDAEILTYRADVAKERPSPDTPLLFAWFPRYPEVQPLQWKWIADNYPNVKKAAKLGVNNDEGITAEEMAKIYAPANGIEIVVSELFEMDMADFSSIILKIMELNADIIDMSGSVAPHLAGTIVKQARELGYTGLFTSMIGPNIDVIIEVAGADYAEGFIGWVSYGEPLLDEQEAFKERYIAKYGNEAWDEFTIFCYTSAQVIPQAIEMAQSLDSYAIAEAMRSGEFDTISGKAYFTGKDFYGVDNQIVWPIPVATAQNGKTVVVDIVEFPGYN